VGALQRFVLQQRSLHQRVDGAGRLAQAIGDRGGRIGIPRCIFQFRKPVEKLVDELAFLRRHDQSPSLKPSARQM